MIRIKKLLAVLFCALICAQMLVPSAYAVKLSAGMEAIRGQFENGCGPSAGGYSISYMYFSPKKSKSDKTKYPLVVFTGGGKQNTYEESEIRENDFPRWASDEYQARFKNAGGAYLLFARAPENTEWNMTKIYDALMAAIEDFIDENSANVDTSRIYLLGWCYGGKSVWKVAASYPDYFAAIMPMSSFYAPTASEARALKNMPVWILACTTDLYTNYSLFSGAAWNTISSVTNVPKKVRLTTFSSYDGIEASRHNAWHIASLDTVNSRNYSDLTNINAKGESLNLPSSGGIISWLSSQSKDGDNTDQANCSCSCHKSGIVKFFWNIQVFFWRFFGVSSKRTCDCGAAHW